MIPATTSSRARSMPASQRRAAIVEATVPLLLEHGEQVTSRQIAEAAGIAEGTIFRVFNDKQELLTAALESALDRNSIDDALVGIDHAIGLDDALIAATEIIQRRITDVWNLLSGLGPELRARAARPMPESDALVALMERHADRWSTTPVEAARLLRALTLALTHPMVAGVPHTAAEIVHFFLHGIEDRQ